ncbi:glutamine--tRNA ligase/YqeY domain fusion protein [Massilia sp. W12]|uniref:glutamine--tRNA ligase/YqeY domain fusion protein n=1 Tax=Massilia sp. W12 TaxID=3126507 RepID=UPI0030D40501
MSHDNHAAKPADNSKEAAPNFLRAIIEQDLAEGKHQRPGLPSVITRFPPEPNGYLHIGHAKSICLNFGLARDYQGRCHMRFDDTNPAKEEQEFVDTILDSVRWLGFDWMYPGDNGAESYLHYASDYFEKLYEMAQYLIRAGFAYVDSQTAEEMRANRGDFNQPGVNSPWRNRPVEESLDLFARMRAGEFPDGSLVLRAKPSEDAMSSPNMNMRDPAIYRIRHAHHHRTGDAWCIYPMYDYTHPISDALEQITHSICTLEFQDHRPFYDWLLETLAEGGMLQRPLPRQYEFARLNMTYVVTSKRKLRQMVEEGIVDGWDDPRMPTIVGLRRRGFTPEAIQLFAERSGTNKSDGWIDISVLEGCQREDLDPKAPRATAVLNPLKLVIDNFPQDLSVDCTSPVHPHHEEMGVRHFPITREVWIERDDFMEVPVKGYFRLYPPIDGKPGNRVRLRHGFVVECTGYEKDAEGNVTTVHCNYFEDSKSGTPGSANYKVKGNIHWVSVPTALAAEVRLYDRLFLDAMPDSGGKDFKTLLNPDAKQVVQAWLEPGMREAQPDQRFQFERHGYFVADRVDSQPGKPVFNRIVTLKDSWGAGK